MSETLVLTRKDYVTRTIIRVIAIVCSIYGMAMSWDSMALTYFTNLSNLMICAALLGSLILDTRSALKSKALSRVRRLNKVSKVSKLAPGWIQSQTHGTFLSL